MADALNGGAKRQERLRQHAVGGVHQGDAFSLQGRSILKQALERLGDRKQRHYWPAPWASAL